MPDKPVYRMSHVGACARALSAQRLGYPTEPTPPWLQRAADEGKMHEIWIRDQLRTEGYEVWADQEELILEYPNFVLTGHIDGRVRKNGKEQLLEIKSMSQYEFDRWMKGRFDEFAAYAAQITCYLKGTGLPEFLYLCKNRSSGYIDRNVIVGAPADFNNILVKLEHIEECVALGTLVDANYNPDSIECRRCNYKDLCVPVAVEFNTVSESRLIEACEKWRTGTTMVNDGEQLVKEAKAIFNEQTEASGQKKWRFNELAISKVEVRESLTYKKDKLLQLFTEEQLKPASEIRMPYSYVKISELRGEEK